MYDVCDYTVELEILVPTHMHTHTLRQGQLYFDERKMMLFEQNDNPTSFAKSSFLPVL